MTKAQIARAVEELPAEATIEDAIARLLFLHRCAGGLKQAQHGDTVALDEVVARRTHRRQEKQSGQP